MDYLQCPILATQFSLLELLPVTGGCGFSFIRFYFTQYNKQQNKNSLNGFDLTTNLLDET